MNQAASTGRSASFLPYHISILRRQTSYSSSVTTWSRTDAKEQGSFGRFTPEASGGQWYLSAGGKEEGDSLEE